MSKSSIDVDCTRRCKSKRHGEELTSSITKRGVTDEALASFIKSKCANFAQAFDFEGRTTLHMCASRGRNTLTDWLVRHSSEAFINAKDRESGYTPLHRSIFYGQIHTAVGLIKIGVNTEIVDKDDYRAIEHAMLDRHYMYSHLGVQPSEVYVWGSNTNYTLGTGNQQMRKQPELLTHFNRSNATVRQVCLGKFHSVWLSDSEGATGAVWVCGQLSRAGAASATALRPAALALHEPCLQAAVTLNSTLLLMQSGAIVQYSLNNTEVAASQSTTKTPSVIKLPSVKPLMKLSSPIGICSGRDHGVAWNKKSVYSWGVNCGQLGHSQPTDRVVDTPKRVTISMSTKEDTNIELVCASDAATVVSTSRGDVYLLHKYICKKIAIKQINLRQVCAEAKVSEGGVYSRVTVLMLTSTGQVLMWEDGTNKVTRLMFGVNHQMSVRQLGLTHDTVYFITRYGEAFTGYISRRSASVDKPAPVQPPPKRDKDNRSALVKFLEKDDCTSVRIVRIPNIHRAVSIAVDSEGMNFACLQIKPSCGLTALPELSPSSMYKHMSSLLETAVQDDMLHDVVFQVGHKQYPAHMFIVASNSELLYQLYQNQRQEDSGKPLLVLENVLPEVFERILKFMYTGSCDVTVTGPCSLKIRKEDLISKREKDSAIEDVESEIIEKPSEISAFAAYNKKKQGRGGCKKVAASQRQTHAHCDPVKLVQAAAKRLQVTALHKALEHFYYRDGCIYLKDSGSWSPSGPVWSRDDLPELVNTAVRSQDGVLVSAHRCVLAARLDYFQGMFMHSWTESKQLSTVSLPINHGILLPIINFLYTDECPEIDSSDSIDFITGLLIVSDQLFITRLREMCEVALANLITLRNCAELCQFAHTYNATQLKQCCMEFISLNLCSFIESRTLEHIEHELLEDISKYYCKYNPIMTSRVITPFYNAPSDETINEAALNYPLDLTITDESMKREDIETKKKHKKKIEYTENEKARKRYESVPSVTSLDLSNETGDITLSLSNISKEEKGTKEKQEKWIAIPTAQQKQKLVQARLKAINSAKDILSESPIESFVTLTKNNSSTILNSHESSPIPTTSRMSVSPKDIFLSEKSSGSITISHVGPKLSQKQRKKLAIQGGTVSPKSLEDYSNNQTIANSPPDRSKNPWKVIKVVEMPVASSSPKAKAGGFHQILADQKKQKDDSSRIMTKPLNITQLEDKAIEELERFYNIHEADDELISIRRIELEVSSPQWIHTASR